MVTLMQGERMLVIRLLHSTMKKFFINIWSFMKEMYDEWTKDNCFQLAASLSYYTLFSIAPMMIVAISLAGYFFGREAVTGELFGQIRSLVGPEGASAVQTMVESAYIEQKG